MKLATASIDITPHMPVKLCGYVNDIRNSQRTQTAHAPIYAMALRLVYDDRQILVLTLDILSIPKYRSDEIKKAIVYEYPIQSDEIIIHAIHTHAGPSGFSVDAMGQEYEDNKEYRESVIDRIVQGLKPVFNNITSIQAKIGKTQIQGFYDNRNDADSYYDAEAFVIRFHDTADNLIAELISMNVHSTVLGPLNMEISYDLIGAIREKLYEKQGIRPLICIGTSADISNRHFRQGDDFKELDRTAKGISNTLLQIDEFKELDMASLVMEKYTYYLKYDNRKNYPAYEEELQKIKQQLAMIQDKTQEKLLLSSKNKQEAKLNIQEVEKEIEISLLRFPQLLIVTFPGELTSVFGKYIKDISHYPYTFFMTCTNDHHGYFIEQEQFGKCYESTATLIPIGETEKIIKELGERI